MLLDPDDRDVVFATLAIYVVN